MPYKRSARVAEEVYQIIAEVCRNELSDPRLKGVQLTGADMTDDLQILKLYYYVEGSQDDKVRSLEGLESAKGYFRRALAKKLNLRIIPEIRYYFDQGIEDAEKLDIILDDLKRDSGMGEDE